VLTRCFFFILDRPWGLPEWAHRALHYAPAAALAGVIAPEIVMTQGHLITTLHDARVYAAVVGAAYFYWRRGVLGTMLAGMAVYLPLAPRPGLVRGAGRASGQSSFTPAAAMIFPQRSLSARESL
jgi:branched-subunit amino acid transport protein